MKLSICHIQLSITVLGKADILQDTSYVQSGANNNLHQCCGCKQPFQRICEMTVFKTKKTKVRGILWLYSRSMGVEIAGKCSGGWSQLVSLLRKNRENKEVQASLNLRRTYQDAGALQ